MIKRLEKTGFTLIELLIVIAIIAILVAIAFPTFLRAQTRTKVSRVSADLRTIASALEAYAVDYNEYPLNDGVYNVIPLELTTPISYLTDARLIDVFSENKMHPEYGELARFFTYTRYVDFQKIPKHSEIGRTPPVEGVDAPGFNEGARDRHGAWKLSSNGPDGQYSRPGIPACEFNPNPLVQQGCDIPYNPTNGTISWGNIIRTQKSPKGEK